MRYYIFVFWTKGINHSTKTIDEQPEEGFNTEQEAELHLLDLIEKRQGYFFQRDWYKFTIMKVWKSKSALNKN